MGQVISIHSKSNAVVTRPERAKLPEDVKQSVDNWRLAGCWQPIPVDYLEWHFHLAGEELDRIADKYRLEILNDPRFVSSDHARAFLVNVLTFRQHALNLQWDDTRQAFMKRVPLDGHIIYEPLRECDLA